MKTQIRRGVFETNSSSTHSMTMCNEVEYDAWKNGELYYDSDQEMLVTDSYRDAEVSRDQSSGNNYLTENGGSKKRFYTEKEFFNSSKGYIGQFETFCQSHISTVGEKIYAFGYFGYDG